MENPSGDMLRGYSRMTSHGMGAASRSPSWGRAYYGHYGYKGFASIFVTMPLPGLWPVLDEAEAAITGGQTSHLTMLTRRLHVDKVVVGMSRSR